MSKLEIDTALIRELADLLRETGLSEIEVGDGPKRLRVARHDAVAAAAVPTASGTGAGLLTAAPEVPAAAPPEGAVTAPMVGTVYVAPEPGAPPFVQVGDEVAEGQTLVIIEAMKVMNPIRAPRAGRVTRIAIADAQPVEYGELLLVIES
jgi:acetyl-CoA carboxylase biotin carboxyl carrier protein